ncbi:MAG: hypothetical protein J6S50_00530 [Oscillospiraceae bacterium]|nr:hypothetical protein [Oscillospiraceae bacterium]MBO7726987.1 hypothetical protein [Oscillospiraceae bacterium]
MKDIRVKLTFTEPILGTASANPEIHSEYIASKAPDAPSKEEEIAAIGAEEYEEKAMTVFPRNNEGIPILFDYQIKGFFKDACSMLQKCRAGKGGKPEEFAKESCALKAYKKIIDGCIFVMERQIPIELNGEMGNLQRPLRGQTAQGERIALANSEKAPAGSSVEFTIRCLSDTYAPAVMEWLNYGALRGIGQWRNGSYGRFEYKIIE